MAQHIRTQYVSDFNRMDKTDIKCHKIDTKYMPKCSLDTKDDLHVPLAFVPVDSYRRRKSIDDEP